MSSYVDAALFIRALVYPTNSQGLIPSVSVVFLDARERKLRIPGKNPKSCCSNKPPNTLTMGKDLPF